MPDSQETTSSAYLASRVSLETLGKVNFMDGASGTVLYRIEQLGVRREVQVKSFELAKANEKNETRMASG
jgi:hypothetical protein